MNRALLALALCLVCAQSTYTRDRVDAFIASLDHAVPELLLRHGVPSAVVSVVHHGRTTTRSWGVADVQTGRMPADTTLYNVASISKIVTAWAVMYLVEQGRIDLDAPIGRYLSTFTLPPSDANDAVTIRRVLSHTSGLSMPAVPWYEPGQAVPSLSAMLANATDPLRLIDRPGAASHYSGGGYALLQLLIEEVTGEKYETFVTRTILKPLGMSHSTFDPTAAGGDVATPYDEALRPEPYYRFAANAAAGLYTTASDLAKLAEASSASSPGGRVLRPATLRAMQQQQQPETPNPFGHALGYGIVPLPSGGYLVGHTGSNEGWTALWDLLPSTGDAIVVLLNRTGGLPVYRELLCDWVDAVNGARWSTFCAAVAPTWTADHTAFVDSIAGSFGSTDPALAILVANDSGVVYRKAFGASDARAGTRATPETPFYIASLAKSMTAIAALRLVTQRRWNLNDPIGRFLPELPEYVRGVTIDQLLSHTSGIPNYQDLIDWSRYDGMDNSKVVTLLRTRTTLDFPAGSTYAYSNSGYVLLASAIERLTGRSYRDVLQKEILGPLAMRSTNVADGRQAPPKGRAFGYARQDGAMVLSDYHVVTVRGAEFPLRSSTLGAGGMYSTLDDLYALDRGLYTVRLLPLPLQMMTMMPRTRVGTELEVPVTTGHGYGWFVSRQSGRNLVWNSGDFAGHHTAILRAPDEKTVIIVLSSDADRDAIAIARQIAAEVLPKKE